VFTCVATLVLCWGQLAWGLGWRNPEMAAPVLPTPMAQ
jgi:hypothetical protein